MKKLILLGVATTAMVIAGVSGAKTINHQEEELNANIIVQLKDNVANKSSEAIIREQNSVLRYISDNITSDYDVITRYSSLFSGLELKVNAAYVDDIRSLSFVSRVDYNKSHSVSYSEPDLARLVTKSIEIKEKKDNISAQTMEVPEENNGGEGVTIAILDTGYMIHGKTYDENDKVVKEDVTHNGYTALSDDVKVALTKDGIQAKIAATPGFHGKNDGTHSTYYNNKVPFFYDYGGLTHERGKPGEEDFDVFSKGQDHGNHVATSAAGNDPYYKGIAPKAQLVLMKVFTDYEPTPADEMEGAVASTGAYDSCILKALEDCEALGVDIVSMSLGSSLDDFDQDSIVQAMIRKMQSEDIFVNVAAGNEGKNTFTNSPYEFWKTDMSETGILSSYSNNEGAMTVAASQADKEYYETAFIIDGNKTVKFQDQITNYTSSSGDVKYNPERHLADLLVDHPDGNFEWVKVGGYGEEKDYTDDIDAEGKIVIVDRGETTFLEKITIATEHGAIAVGIINNDPSETDFTFRMDLSGNTPSVPVVSLLFKDRETFVNAKTNTAKLFSNTEADNPTARMMTSFSSDGPTYDLRLKPEISTPGQSILGGVLDDADAYDYYNGTSMATPNYSGALALVLAKDPTNTTYRRSINARMMSTADQALDENKNFSSVRRQGAGLANVGRALSSELYLDGSIDEQLTGKAKIELGNSEKIRNGVLSLSFTTVNGTAESVDYTATVYIYRPDLVEISSDERFEDYKGKFQATYNKLVEKYTTSVTLVPGQNLVTLPDHTLPAKEIAEINANFEGGCYIEGYVVLEAEDQPRLSIPYLGYYGKIEDLIPVEPFTFERDSKLTYQSDLVNYVARKWGGSPEADFSSQWVSGYFKSMKDIGVDSYLLNEKKLTDLSGSNKKNLTPVCYNPYDGSYTNGHIYMGNNGANNTMIITQFVLRSVATNTLTITNKASGEVVLVDHMFDDLYGATEDETGKEIAWPLYKSHIDTSALWTNKLYAHRAYTLIPLYNYTYNETTKEYKIGENYPDGEYEIKFNYTLSYGGTFTKEYTLHIDSEAPKISSADEKTLGSKSVLSLRFDDQFLSFVSVNGDTFEAQKDSEGYYVNVDKDVYSAKNKLFIKATDMSGATSQSMTYLDDERHVVVTNNNINGTYEFVKTEKETSNEYTLSIGFTKGGKEATLSGETSIVVKLPEKFASVEDLEVTSAGGELLSYSIGNGFLRATFKDANVSLRVKDPNAPAPAPSSGGNAMCGGNIQATSITLSVLALSLAGLLLAVKSIRKKEDR